MARACKPYAARQLGAAEVEKWDALVAAAPEGSVYQESDYLTLVSRITDATCRLIGVFRDNAELVGGIGVYEQPSWAGLCATSRRLLYYNGPFVAAGNAISAYRSESHRRRVLRVIEEFLRTANYRLVRFKARHESSDYRTFIARGWSLTPVYSYECDLRNLEKLWSRIDRNLRRLIVRCGREKMVFVDDGDFDAFFSMHEATHLRKGAPLYLPRERFGRFVAEMREAGIGRLFQVATSDGSPIASQLVIFGKHPVAQTLAAASDAAYRTSGCNAHLRWKVFEWLAERGYEGIDLTDAHIPSVARFKSQLGADLRMGLEIERYNRPIAELAEATLLLAKRAAAKLYRLGFAKTSWA